MVTFLGHLVYNTVFNTDVKVYAASFPLMQLYFFRIPKWTIWIPLFDTESLVFSHNPYQVSGHPTPAGVEWDHHMDLDELHDTPGGRWGSKVSVQGELYQSSLVLYIQITIRLRKNLLGADWLLIIVSVMELSSQCQCHQLQTRSCISSVTIKIPIWVNALDVDILQR